MKFYKAVDSTGYTHTRSTASRSYSHAAVLVGRGGSSWARTRELAEKAAGGREMRYWLKDGFRIEVLAAEEIAGAEYRAILKAHKAK